VFAVAVWFFLLPSGHGVFSTVALAAAVGGTFLFGTAGAAGAIATVSVGGVIAAVAVKLLPIIPLGGSVTFLVASILAAAIAGWLIGNMVS